MNKKLKDLTEHEQIAFVTELARMHTFGLACLIASAQNLNEEQQGWPPISIGTAGEDIQVSLCDALDMLHGNAKATVTQDITSRPFGLLLLSSIEHIEELVTHEAMHDAFCLGVASVSLMELDFSGVDEILDLIARKGNSHV